MMLSGFELSERFQVLILWTKFYVNVSLKLVYTFRPKIIAVADIVGHNGVLDYLKIFINAVTCQGILGLSRHVT